MTPFGKKEFVLYFAPKMNVLRRGEATIGRALWLARRSCNDCGIFLWHQPENCVLDSVLISKEKGRKIEHFNI